MTPTLRRRLLGSLFLAVLLYVGLAVYGDWQQLRTAVAAFPRSWLPAVVGLTLANYLGRLIKWHWYLQLVGVPISRTDSARIFGVGMLMVMTPGKVGEFLKSYMVRNVAGTPMSVTAPVVLAERLTDGLAMMLLAGAGVFAFLEGRNRLLVLVILLAMLTLIAVIQVRPLALWFLRTGQRMPVARRFAGGLAEFYESSYILFRPANLIPSVLLGGASWLCEGIAYFVVLRGLGIADAFSGLLMAIFIFNISTILGAVIGTPGGLGGAEGALVTLSIRLFQIEATPATAAALLIRFATLWFGVLLGMISLALWPELMENASGPADQAGSPA